MAITVLFALYCLAAFCLFIYGINCYLLVNRFRRHRQQGLDKLQKVREVYKHISDQDLPTVTIQLPIYNERWVVGRLIQAVCHIQWPREKLEIQVLDDSTDDTTPIIQELVTHFQSEGLSITHLHRTHREGFKAGALQAGLMAARGKLIAIFDSDFVPHPDFLRQTVPFFSNPKIGMVQTRWSHLNENYSFLTRIQAVAIDRHFGVEQSARCWAGFFLNFNGTGGVWRRTAIEQAGGWEPDTLTEDLDLSYRAQLHGWKMEYLPDVDVPSEIPIDLPAFKSQQRRWAKGSIQTAIKLLPRVFSSQIPLFTKLQAFIHLTHYLIHPLMLIIALTFLPLMTFESSLWAIFPFAPAFIFLCLATAGPSALYITAQQALHKNWRRRILWIPALMVIGTGLAVSNTRAVLEACIGTANHFVRTPKHNIIGMTNGPQTSYPLMIFDSVSILEALMAIYCVFGLIWSLQIGQYMISPFLFLYAAGFALMVFFSTKEAALLRWHPQTLFTSDNLQSHVFASERAYKEALGLRETAPLKPSL